MNSHPYLKPSPSWSKPSFIREEERPLDSIRIKASFEHYLPEDSEFDLFTKFMEKTLQRILPHWFLQKRIEAGSPAELRSLFQQFRTDLPIIASFIPSSVPGVLQINTLCSSTNVQGLGRFMSDLCSRWLIPGRRLAILCAPSLHFHFADYDRLEFFLQQISLKVSTESDLAIITKNLDSLQTLAKRIILAVQISRSIIHYKTASDTEKLFALNEEIRSLVQGKESESSLFDHAQELFIRASSENKSNQIKEAIFPLLSKQSKYYSTDIFYDIQYFGLNIKDYFTATHQVSYLAKLIAIQYLFRKLLVQAIHQAPDERHVFLKLLKTRSGNADEERSVLGILIAMNISKKGESFEQKHIFEAILHTFPKAMRVEGSLLTDVRELDTVKLFYLEIFKVDGTAITPQEVIHLRKVLPAELKARVEQLSSKLFMPRNEEEVMRNIVLLSHELQYVSDLPQVVISFDSQSEKELSFTVIIVRLLRPNGKPIETFFNHLQSLIRCADLEKKEVGYLRRKYPKEASVMSLWIDKASFLRKDHSVDLFKARQFISAELNKVFKGIRDFNGGILSKKEELFTSFKESLPLGEQANLFSIENFFYNISPPLMQSLLPASLLQELYLLALKVSKEEAPFSIIFKEHFFFAACKKNYHTQNDLRKSLHTLGIPDLCSTSTQINHQTIIGYLCRIHSEENLSQLLSFFNTNKLS